MTLLLLRLWLRWLAEALPRAGLPFPVAVAGALMIRCSGLLMRRWMSWVGWRGRKRSWRR